MTRSIEVYDTTLRDGTQGEGVNLSLEDKLYLTRILDDLGVDFIEGGWPGSNPKDEAYFRQVQEMALRHARIAAFGSTRRAKLAAADDPNLQKLVASQAGVCTIFGKTWDLHVTEALRISLDDNLAMIADSVAYLRAETGRPVFYDAEHFFDGWKANPSFALDTLQAAHEAGAERLILCDTNGGSLPSDIEAGIDALRQRLGDVALGIHVHNDGGLAVANTLVALQVGAVQVQGTINGVGERCGNVDLCAVLANCELKLAYSCLPPGRLQDLTQVSRSVWERINQVGPINQPYVGKAAFAHKGGIHVSAVQRNALTYEHVQPESVGNTRRVLISELSGRSNVQAKLSNRYPELKDATLMAKVLDDVQTKENDGYSYEAAEASFDLMVRRHVNKYRPLFDLHYYRVHGLGTDQSEQAPHLVEAICKLTVRNPGGNGDGDLRLFVAEGHGPVDALAHALMQALTPAYPQLEDIHLIDYKVRVVNSADGTAAKVRVLIEHRFRSTSERFSTIGVSENIIEASWNALVEAATFTVLSRE
jgi:2-isopropylmalate synthase